MPLITANYGRAARNRAGTTGRSVPEVRGPAELRVPTLNANDASYTLLGWLIEDGAAIAAGDPMVEIETAKAVEEIPAPAGGFVVHLVPAGTEVLPGQVIATVAAARQPGSPPAPPPVPDRPEGHAAEPAAGAQVITGPARERMAELGVTEIQVGALPARLVRRTDIDALATRSAPVEPAGVHRLTRLQRAVGRAVSQSRATIPAAYTVLKMDVGPALARARGLVRQVRQPVGLPNVFITALAELYEHFPLFYGQLGDDGSTVYSSGAAHIGVTVDVGAGLYLPVLRNAATLSPADIAGRLAEFRRCAADGTFRASDLDGANIGLTLHTDPDIVLAIPFIFPGQVCALALTAPVAEVVLDSDGQVAARTVAHIGLAYDHRVINGREAALYLHALRDRLA
jgi:2-oxoglutarate dehydrogenase E2 component (dihydrolipoamide succinyltransferase)